MLVVEFQELNAVLVIRDFVSGLPFHAADKLVQMVHAHFEGAQPKGEAKTFAPVKCQGDPNSYLIYAPLAQNTDYVNVGTIIFERCRHFY
jgi:hypothetical protein